jgi:hypothetical protein
LLRVCSVSSDFWKDSILAGPLVNFGTRLRELSGPTFEALTRKKMTERAKMNRPTMVSV